MCAGEEAKEEGRCGWQVRKEKKERDQKKKKRWMFVIWSIVPFTTILSTLHLCLFLVWSTGISWGSTFPPYITTSTKPPTHQPHPLSIQHAQDRVPLVSPLREVERILQHSRAVIPRGTILPQGELPPAVSVPWNGWWQQLETQWRKDSRGYTHCAYHTLVCTHPHRDQYIYVKYIHTHTLRCTTTILIIVK